MAEESKFYRLPNGKAGRVDIIRDDHSSAFNPRRDEDLLLTTMRTFDGRFVSPDDTALIDGRNVGDAIDRWTDSYGVDGRLFVRYLRMFHADALAYVGGLVRDRYDGTLSIDHEPVAGIGYAGIVVISRASLDKAGVVPGENGAPSARDIAEDEVKRYSAWVVGDVYGYRASVDGIEIESVWGYVGDDEIAYMHSQGLAILPEGAVEIAENEYHDLINQSPTFGSTFAFIDDSDEPIAVGPFARESDATDAADGRKVIAVVPLTQWRKKQ